MEWASFCHLWSGAPAPDVWTTFHNSSCFSCFCLKMNSISYVDPQVDLVGLELRCCSFAGVFGVPPQGFGFYSNWSMDTSEATVWETSSHHDACVTTLCSPSSQNIFCSRLSFSFSNQLFNQSTLFFWTMSGMSHWTITSMYICYLPH